MKKVNPKDMALIQEKITDLIEIEWGYEGIREDVADIFNSVIGKCESELGDEYKVCPFCGGVIEE